MSDTPAPTPAPTTDPIFVVEVRKDEAAEATHGSGRRYSSTSPQFPGFYGFGPTMLKAVESLDHQLRAHATWLMFHPLEAGDK
jgi:hypothetical protein